MDADKVYVLGGLVDESIQKVYPWRRIITIIIIIINTDITYFSF